jgi:hypothetical protein
MAAVFYEVAGDLEQFALVRRQAVVGVSSILPLCARCIDTTPQFALPLVQGTGTDTSRAHG